MNNEAISERDMVHRYADLLDDGDLPEVKMILQQYVARKLNRQYNNDCTEKATR